MQRLILFSALFATSTPVMGGPPVDRQGDRLPEGAIARFGSTRLLHGPEVKSLLFSADGKTLISSDYSEVRLWDVTSGRLLNRATLPFFAPSPVLLVNETVLAKFVEGGRPPLHYPGDFDSDSARGKVPYQALDIRTGKLSNTIPQMDATIHCLDSSPDGRHIAIRELENLGEMAESELEVELARKPVLEVSIRIENLLRQINDPITAPARLRELRAIEVLERIGTEEAREVLRGLAAGTAQARLTQEAKAALERLSPRR